MTQLQIFLDAMGVTVTSAHVALVLKGEGEPWSHDKWRVTVHYMGKTHSTEFRTGLGNRTLSRGVKAERGGYYIAPPVSRKVGTLEQLCAAYPHEAKPTPPTSADVVSCLVSDARSAEETFESWCADMGADTDSRKAFATYQACMATRDAMVKLFGQAGLEEISQQEH